MSALPPLPPQTTEFHIPNGPGVLPRVAKAMESAGVIGFIEIDYDSTLTVTVRSEVTDRVRSALRQRHVTISSEIGV